MKKILSQMLIVAILIGISSWLTPTAEAADKVAAKSIFENIDYQKSTDIRVIIEGKQIVFDVNPQIINGRTLVPMRIIFESFGMAVDWDGITRTATGKRGNDSIAFTIGSNKAVVNGEEKLLDVPASIIGERTMIPLRFLSENLGYKVVWIGDSNLILISRADIIEWRYGGFESILPYKEYEHQYINGVKTAETRYNGKNHEVKHFTLYSNDGRIVPNVPEFSVASYGSAWYKQSPFVGKTYWVDLGVMTGSDGNSSFFDPANFSPITSVVLSDSVQTGNYLKVKVEDHYVDIAARAQIGTSAVSDLGSITDIKLLNGREVKSYDTILKVTINDRYSALLLSQSLLNPLLQPAKGSAYTVFEQDPRTVFKWDDAVWTKLKAENPWNGMSKDMLLVQTLREPDQISKTTTRTSVYELWVYEYEYVDSVFLFDDGTLISIL